MITDGISTFSLRLSERVFMPSMKTWNKYSYTLLLLKSLMNFNIQSSCYHDFNIPRFFSFKQAQELFLFFFTFRL